MQENQEKGNSVETMIEEPAGVQANGYPVLTVDPVVSEAPGVSSEGPSGDETSKAPKGKGKARSKAQRPARRESVPDLGPKVVKGVDGDPELSEMGEVIAADSALESDTESEAGPQGDPTQAVKGKRGRPKGPRNAAVTAKDKAKGKAGAKGKRGRPKGSGNKVKKDKGQGTALAKAEEKALPPMTTDDFTRLQYLESVVEKGMSSFLETGNALLEISVNKLYRSTYATYPEYLEARWQISERQARYLSGAASVVKSLESSGVASLPTNAAQTRHLIGLADDLRVKAYNLACELASNEGFQSPQERHVKAASDKLTGKGMGEPRDVTKARADGVIAPETPVSVSEVGEEPGSEDITNNEIDQDSPDMDWLAQFPIRGQLSDFGRQLFDQQALGYRFINDDRVKFVETIKRKVGEVRGPYFGRLLWVLSRPDPSVWVVCQTCKGTGTAEIVGANVSCPDCKKSSPKPETQGVGFIVP